MWLLLLAVLLLRAVVPQGWMPDTDASGRLVVRICDGAGAMVLPRPDAPQMHGAHHGGGHGEHADHGSGGDDAHDQCAFAGLSAPAASAPPVLLPAPLPPVAYFTAPRPETGLRTQSTALPPPARAPPVPA